MNPRPDLFSTIDPVTRIVVEDQLGRKHNITGREAWALNALIERGELGCTPIDYPAPRWSHYVFLLRGRGIDVETIHEGHGGAFSGHHGRYVLRSAVKVLSVTRASEEWASKSKGARHAA